ncbi:hypothetical protein [Streptomyces sp. YIM S03343]
MDLATLKNLKPSEFEQAADGYRATSDMAGAAKDEIDNVIVAGMNESLKGQALTAAIRELKKLSANFHYTQTECSLASVALNGFAYDMDSVRKKLLSALDDAAARKFTVNPDGSVTYPEGQPANGVEEPPKGGSVSGATDPTAQAVERQSANLDPNPHHAEALAIADRIAAALNEATEADSKWEPKLRALKADDDLTVSNRDRTDAGSDTSGVSKAAEHYLDSIAPPPKDGDPKANAEWWKGLTPEQREAYLALHPKDVGRMNGLPAEVRDEANRTVLDETRAQYQLDLDALPPEPTSKYTWITTARGPVEVYTDEWISWNSKYGDRTAALQKVLKGVDAIQDRFDRTGQKGLPEAYLLGFDPKGEDDGRVIIANGNPDTAIDRGNRSRNSIECPASRPQWGEGGVGPGRTPAAARPSPPAVPRPVRVLPRWRMGGAEAGAQGWGYAQPTRAGHVPVPPPARGQPRRLVALVGGGVRGGAPEW